MANEVEIRVTADTKAAERGLKDMRGAIDKFAKRARVAGAALTAIGVGGAVGIMKLVNSYKEQEIGISRLDQALVNIGTSYGDNEAAIEGLVSAIQNKTNYADEVSRDVLTRLVGVLGDEKKAMEALPVVLDAAAFAGKDASAVAETLSKFLAGLTNTSDATGVSVDATATFAERLAEVMGVAGGQAEAAVDPMTQLGNRASDTGQSFGQHLSPFIDEAAKILERLLDKFSKLDPKWQRAISLIAGLTVVFALIAGPILLLIGFLPLLIGGFGALAAAALPITLAIAGIAAAVFAGILIWRNWDTIVAFLKRVFESRFAWLLPGGALNQAILDLKDNWREVWSRIQEIFQMVAKNVLQGLETILNGIVDMVNGALRIAKKLGFMSDVAELDKFELDYDVMMMTIKKKTIEIVNAVVEKTKELGASIKEDLGDAWLEVQGFYNDFVDNVMGGADDLEEQVKKTNDAIGVELPDATEKGGAGLAALGDEYSKAGDKIKTFNELVQAGQFKTRVRGGMPEVVAYGAGERTGRGIPSMDIFAQQDLLLGVARIVNEAARQRSLENTLRQFGGQVIDELKFIVEHIKQEGTFTQQAIERFSNRVKADAAIAARKRPLLEAWAMNTLNPAYARNLQRRQALRIQEQTKSKRSIGFNVDPEEELAKGGIVTRPTIALLGEAGPEAIIPLRGGGAGMAPTYNITISGNTVFGEMDFKRLVVKAVTDSHRRGGLPFLGK